MSDYEILLLGDGSHLFRTIGWVLEYKGYRVRAAASPEAALEALVKKNFDLVIAKLTGEVSDGLDVLKRAKKLNPEVKVMVVSGNHETVFPLEAYQLEIDDYILMPISPAELWRRVNQCLERVVELKPIKTLVMPAAQTVTAVPKTELNDLVLNRMMMMFHDIRGSMVSAAAALKLVARGTYGEIDERVADKLHEVQSRVRKLVNLTEEFMGKALGNGEAKSEEEILDLKMDIVEPVLHEFSEEIQDRGIHIDNRLNSLRADCIPVKGSKLWLKSVFRNLLANGIEYGGKGGNLVIALEDQGSNCRLKVYNSGKPVPEAYRPLLFSKARHLNPGAKGNGRGLGLGLYLSRDLIHEHGGDIWYEPQNDGSNFIVELPQV
jgi:two-component system sensor histidine kinase/response regulator